MCMALEREFKYYLANQDAFVKKYAGRVIAIKDEEVLGDFESEIAAVETISKKYEMGTFLVQKCY